MRIGIVFKDEDEVSRAEANEILHEQFPQAPKDVVEAACERLYGHGGDWVRIPPVKVFDATNWKASTEP